VTAHEPYPTVRRAFLAVTLAAGLAGVVRGHVDALRGLVTSAATLLVALGVVWVWRAGARGLTGR
jgi:uncharacterized membrane protein YozB (DUF420 family)